MTWRRVVSKVAMLALLSAGVSLVGLGNVAQASSQRPQASQVVYGAPTESAKVTLSDTSIDGPAIATAYPGDVIAWAGTDSLHHLNVMTSSDGLSYSDKHILPETSNWRPAVAFISSLRGLPLEGTLVLAWTGTDPHHTLNLELISMPAFKVTQKIIFWGETSFTAPAVSVLAGDINSDIYLAWAGTDYAHTLNVIHRTTMPQSQDKKTFWGWSSMSRPNLYNDLANDSKGGEILAWTGVSNNRVYFAYSAKDTSNRTYWTMPSTSPLSQQSAWAPSMIGFSASTQPTHWVAWTGSGTTSDRALNVMYTQHYPTWSEANAQATFNETAISGPALAIVPTSGESQVLIGWAGTDPAHHLNVAIVTAPA